MGAGASVIKDDPNAAQWTKAEKEKILDQLQRLEEKVTKDETLISDLENKIQMKTNYQEELLGKIKDLENQVQRIERDAQNKERELEIEIQHLKEDLQRTREDLKLKNEELEEVTKDRDKLKTELEMKLAVTKTKISVVQVGTMNTAFDTVTARSIQLTERTPADINSDIDEETKANEDQTDFQANTQVDIKKETKTYEHVFYNQAQTHLNVNRTIEDETKANEDNKDHPVFNERYRESDQHPLPLPKTSQIPKPRPNWKF